MKLFSRSPRWCHLSTALWSMVVVDSGRQSDVSAVGQFLDVMHWRAHGKITSEEFTYLHNEWMMISVDGTTLASTPALSPNKKKSFIPLSAFRNVLLEKGYQESDLDLFLGMVINEANMRLLNSTINFVSKKVNVRHQAALSLEVVNQRWLALSEELFFSLDTPGYGVWKFDETFFFCSCLKIGLQGWSNDSDLEADLGLPALTATTLQMMREAGAHLLVTSTRNSLWDGAGARESDTRHSQRQPPRGASHSAKQEITLLMFKRFLLRKNLGESELLSLLQHVKFAVERVVKLVKAIGAEDFFLGCQPIEHRGQVIGSPRLWQESVLIAAGYVQQITGYMQQSQSQTLPPILLFLLSDAERYVTGSFRAVEFLVDDNGFADLLPNGLSGEASSANPLFSAQSANEELHETTQRIWNQFRKWNQEGGSLSASIAGNNPFRDNTQSASNAAQQAEWMRDPVYKLILAVLVQYKTLQQVANAALFDFGVSQFGSQPRADASDVSSSNALASLCAGVLPQGRDILIELGIESAGVENAKSVTANQLTVSAELASYSDFPISESTRSTPRGSSSDQLLSSRTQTMGSTTVRNSLESTQKNDMNVVEDDYSSVGEAVSQSTSQTSVKKISDLPVAASRRKSLLSSSAQPSPPAPPASSAPERTSVKPKTVASKKQSPHYFKPTATYLAKSAVRSQAIDSETSSVASDVMIQHNLQTSEAQRRPATNEVANIRRTDAQPSPMPLSAPPQAPIQQWESIWTKAPAEDMTSNAGGESSFAVRQVRSAPAVYERANSSTAAATPPTSDLNALRIATPSHSPVFQQENHQDDTAEDSPQSLNSSIAAGSIQELLQQGHSPGKYAHMLREILRKMSKDDSQVRLRSLEQVIKLGEQIVDESAEKRKLSPILGMSMNGNTNAFGSTAAYAPNTSTAAGLKTNTPSNAGQSNSRLKLAATQSSLSKEVSQDINERSRPTAPMKVIARSSRAPGHMPNEDMRKAQKQAFGHPANG